MPLPSSGPISLTQIAAEFGVSLPARLPTNFYGKPGIPASGPLAMTQFRGLSNATFTPDGGGIVESGFIIASATLRCSIPATWTWSVNHPAGSASLPSGASSTEITFSANSAGYGSVDVTFTVTGNAGGVVRSFSVRLLAGDGS